MSGARRESEQKVRIGFIGAGTVGTALALGLGRKGYPVVAVSSRTSASAGRFARLVQGCTVMATNQAVSDNADFVFITTPDDVIPVVASQLKWHAGQSVVHCSGADTVQSLTPAAQVGAHTGGFHPLQTFANLEQAIKNVPGSTFALEAQTPLLSTLKDMAISLDGQWIELKSENKVLYHAAAVMACNYLVTLAKMSTDLWKVFGVEPKEAIQALQPLIKGTLNNLENVGLPNCLTGPIARGDLGTVRKHLDALAKSAPELLSAYKELGLQTLPIALAKGRIDEKKAGELKMLLSARETAQLEPAGKIRAGG